jgi:outer membrane protein assembly factor BamB
VSSAPVVAAAGTLYIGALDYLWALTPEGAKSWSFRTGFIYTDLSIGPDGTIYMGTYENSLGYLKAIYQGGGLKWKFGTGRTTSTPAVGADGIIYLGADYGNIFAVNSNGNQRWRFETTDDVSSSPVVGSDGTVYIGCCDKNLYALYGISQGLADSPWPMFLHDVRHTGRLGGNPVFTLIAPLLLDD